VQDGFEMEDYDEEKETEDDRWKNLGKIYHMIT
jgi:hypothetical protein